MGRESVKRKEELLVIQSIITSSVKHDGGIFMAWASTVATGTASLVFIGDVTADFQGQKYQNQR